MALPCGLVSRNLLLLQGGDTIGEVARGMIEDVHEAIFDLVELIKTFQSKNRLSRLLMSTLFRRRQQELDAVVNQAIMRLQVSRVYDSTAFCSGTHCACICSFTQDALQ